MVEQADMVIRGPWSAAERDNLRRAHAQGMPYKMIAQELGRSAWATLKQAQRMHLPLRRRWWTLYEMESIITDRPIKVLAAELHRSYASVATARCRAKHMTLPKRKGASH